MKTVMATGTFDLLHPGHGLYLQKAKELGGKDAKLIVVVARDSTVRRKKRIPIIDESQRLEMIRMLKPVDEAYLGHPTDMFKIVREIRPDIIAIGSDQSYEVEQLKKDLENQKITCEVKRVNNYRKAKLDSTCKIIKKIKNSDFTEKSFKDC
ncbi:Bifunctional protein HldE [bioreactor metagenome]|uniref:Bifunctional protein HldE n=1 Tax=bioreactor metagenome TaxID=1076179 RepID=A0A644X608_9ZZZZ|nr:adenylyltransferase/cytidyltransferase family protein [Methanobrevibacter sp.]MEA4957961.1 adenylyltransferase/cytidyltransferase family protein [Methanobrevibacter sp.]